MHVMGDHQNQANKFHNYRTLWNTLNQALVQDPPLISSVCQCLLAAFGWRTASRMPLVTGCKQHSGRTQLVRQKLATFDERTLLLGPDLATFIFCNEGKETLLIRSYGKVVAYWIMHTGLAQDEMVNDSCRYLWQSSLSLYHTMMHQLPGPSVQAALASRACNGNPCRPDTISSTSSLTRIQHVIACQDPSIFLSWS